MSTITAQIRPLVPDDHTQWLHLWKGYQAFYEADIPDAVSETTWRRFHDPALPIHALGAEIAGSDGSPRLVGIVHYLYHLTCWTVEPYCYLQDLYVDADARSSGAGRALIEAVYAAARQDGAGRVYWLTEEDNHVARGLYDTMADRPGFIQYRHIFDARNTDHKEEP
ncbi:MAG: GNAT family N-acetyltransferase [Pseudomonadota bacterium]